MDVDSSKYGNSIGFDPSPMGFPMYPWGNGRLQRCGRGKTQSLGGIGLGLGGRLGLGGEMKSIG